MMHPVFVRWRMWGWLVAAPAIVAGCRAPTWPKAPVADVEPELLDRKQQVVRDFERKRDEAEYAAAYDRWQVKDYAGCREGLNSLGAGIGRGGRSGRGRSERGPTGCDGAVGSGWREAIFDGREGEDAGGGFGWGIRGGGGAGQRLGR
ncbi:MAG: hypothetical protein K8T25_19475, partial [Planctomycetia bacterium]|nr:hypothetical protein [Planctomycetia bacterium]